MNRLKDYLKVEKAGKTLAEQYVEQNFNLKDYEIIQYSRYFIKVKNKKSLKVLKVVQDFDELYVYECGIKTYYQKNTNV